MLRILAIGALLGATPAAAQTTIEAHDTRPTLAQRNGLRANFETQFAHHYVQVNGFRLHHVIGGPADGTFIVLIHGWPQTWYTWRNVMPAPARTGYRVVAVDYRGAGDSSNPLRILSRTTILRQSNYLARLPLVSLG